MRGIFLSMLLFSLPLCGDAEGLELQDYERNKGNEQVELYLNGVAKGIFWSSLHGERQGNASLYCHPDNIALTSSQYISILDRYIAGQSLVPDYPVELAMLLALRDAFPCKG